MGSAVEGFLSRAVSLQPCGTRGLTDCGAKWCWNSWAAAKRPGSCVRAGPSCNWASGCAARRRQEEEEERQDPEVRDVVFAHGEGCQTDDLYLPQTVLKHITRARAHSLTRPYSIDSTGARIPASFAAYEARNAGSRPESPPQVSGYDLATPFPSSSPTPFSLWHCVHMRVLRRSY